MSTIEKRALSGGFANLLLFIFTFIQSIALVPVFLNNWGKEKYGIWIAIYAFFTLAKTLDLGHQNYIGNEIIKYYQSDLKKAKEIFASGLKMAYLIGFAELLLGAILLYFFSPFFWDINRGQHQFTEAYFGTLALLAAWMIIGSVGGIWARLLVATGQFTRATYWGLIYKVLETGALLYAVISKSSILFSSILLAGITLAYSAVCIMDIKRACPSIFPYKLYGKFKIGYQNFSKSIVLTASGVAEQSGNNLQIGFVSSTSGKGFIPVLTTVKTITNVAVQVIVIFTAPITVDIIRLYVQGSKEKIPELFSVIWLVTLVTIYLPFVFFTPFVEGIYKLWTHNLLPFNRSLYYLLALSVCIISFGTPFKLLLTGINHLRSITAISIIRFAVLCIIPFGIHKWGLTMIGAAVFLSEVMASIVVPFIFVRNRLQMFGTPEVKKLLLVSLLPLLLIGVFFCFASGESSFHSSLLTTAIFLVVLLIIGALHWNLLKKETRQRIFVSTVGRLNVKKPKPGKE